MARLALVLLISGALCACDRNPEAPEHKSAEFPMNEQSNGLPPGHPPMGQGQAQGMPPGHPDVQGLPPGHPSMPGQSPSGGSATGEPGAPAAGGLAWKVEAPFESQPVSSGMRAAEYKVEGAKGQDPANLVVYYFGPGQGGGVQANIDRWVGQFEQPAGSKPKIEKRTIHGMTVTVADVTGTYQPMQMPGQAAAGPEAAQRMLAAIVDGPKGPVFFKMVGPKAVVTKAKPAFDKLLDSIHKS